MATAEIDLGVGLMPAGTARTPDASAGEYFIELRREMRMPTNASMKCPRSRASVRRVAAYGRTNLASSIAICVSTRDASRAFAAPAVVS